MNKTKRNIGQEILEGLREINRGEQGCRLKICEQLQIEAKNPKALFMVCKK